MELFEVDADDETVRVAFTQAFTFDFYGATYDAAFVNTNGGLTFGAGSIRIDSAAERVAEPGIGAMWGDMVVADGATITVQQCPEVWSVTFREVLDYDKSRKNTATVRLWADGTVHLEYGDVGSQDLLVGLWDGTHTNDVSVSVANTVPNYPDAGTGVLLFDYWADKTDRHTGSLSGRTVRFEP